MHGKSIGWLIQVGDDSVSKVLPSGESVKTREGVILLQVHVRRMASLRFAFQFMVDSSHPHSNSNSDF